MKSCYDCGILANCKPIYLPPYRHLYYYCSVCMFKIQHHPNSFDTKVALHTELLLLVKRSAF